MVETAQAPAKWPSASVPMYWNESKSEDFWSTIIELLDIGQIVDASPGCGTLAGAAMDADIPYLGIVRSELHLTWLGNQLDKDCLYHLAQDCSPLFNQDLAILASTHVSQILEGYDAPDVDEEALKP